MAFSDFLDSHFYTTVLGLEFCRQMRNWIVQRRTIITFEDQDQSEKLMSRMELSKRAEGGEPLPTWAISPASSGLYHNQLLCHGTHTMPADSSPVHVFECAHM
jgi:hypothetical protein